MEKTRHYNWPYSRADEQGGVVARTLLAVSHDANIFLKYSFYFLPPRVFGASVGIFNVV